MNYTGQFYSENEISIKKEACQNDFVDVCSTEDNNENKENLTKSPRKKNCLVTTFSRMSPFKVRQPLAQLPNLKLSPQSKKSKDHSPARTSLMQRFTNFTSQNLSPTTSQPASRELKPKKSENVKLQTQVNQKSCNQSNQWELNTNNSSNAFSSTLADAALSNNEKFFTTNFSSFNLNNKTSRTLKNVRENSQFSQCQPTVEFDARDSVVSNDDAESEAEEVNLSETVNSNTGIKASRKEKSLGKLCRRFLLTMGDEAKASTNDVHLESVARKMNVEKRRIYDIVNVMEALEAMSKTNKSFYRWHGLSALPQLMHALQKEAIESNFPERIMQVERAMCSFTELSSVSSNLNIRRCASASKLASNELVGSLVDDCVFSKSPSNISLNSFLKESSVFSQSFNDDPNNWTFQSSDNSFNNSTTSIYSSDLARISHSTVVVGGGDGERNSAVSGSGSGKNSLAQLCRRFLMVLLCNPKDKRRVSLDVASTVLIKDPESEGFEPPSRSRCRRLYDIANVLVAMELIKKVHYLFGTKKIPLFVYCGPEPDASPISAELSMREFLERIGLSGIYSNQESEANNNENFNQFFGESSSYAVGSDATRKFRIPKLQQQSDSSLGKNVMPPPLATKYLCSKSVKNENCTLYNSYPEEQQRPSSKLASCELSSASRSLSSSTSSLSSTLSQPSSSSSSSMQYLAEMAELVRKRLHSTNSTLPVFDRKSRKNDGENKENKTFTKSFRHKRQKIANFPAFIKNNNNNNCNNKELTTNNESFEDLPKPKPMNPLTSLNFLHAQLEQQQNAMGGGGAMATAMSKLLKGISSSVNSSSGLSSTLDFPFQVEQNGQQQSSFSFGNTSLPYFMYPTTMSGVSLAASAPNVKNTQTIFSEQQNFFNKPKVAHSVLSILGVSQAENTPNNLAPTSAFLMSSPKAFKPITSSYNNKN